MRPNFTYLSLMYVSLLFFSGERLFSQTHKPVQSTINAFCGGYYEYLPSGYNPAGIENYPVIIFLHGSGERGNGTSDLYKVSYSGLAAYIEQGKFPQSFTVNGINYKFIVISPQFSRWPTADDVQDVIDYVKSRYKIDVSRIYLTGLSMGGGATWDYAQSHHDAASAIAAIVPVCGASNPSTGTPHIMALAHLPVWATHNDGDPDVPVSNTHGFVAAINGTVPAPRILAKKTIFGSNLHDAWSTTYDPNFRENGLNVYEWMLQHARVAEALPVVLSMYTVSLLPDNTVAVNWTTTFEQNNKEFLIEHSGDGQTFQLVSRIKGTNKSSGSTYKYVHNAPIAGSNFYRLKQVDIDGKTTAYKILSVGLKSPLSGGLLVYPNPSIGYLNVALNNSQRGKIQVSIIDNSGKTIEVQYYNKSGDNWLQTISTKNLAPGHYIMDLKGTNFKGTRNFIKK